MKLSRLKYVFAFVLLVAISVVSTNVQAATPSDSMKLSTVIASKLANIVDGDNPGTVTVDRTVTSFNTEYSGMGMNPVQAYTLKVKSSAASLKGYTLNPAAITTQDAEFNYAGTSSNVRVGLGLAFGLNYLSAYQLENQAAIDSYSKAYSYATQLYLWLANANALGTATEASAVSGLSGVAYERYYHIRNSVEQSLKRPSYAFGTELSARTAKYEMGWSDENQRYEITLTDTEGIDTLDLVNLTIQDGTGINYTKNGNSVTFYSNDIVGTTSNPVTVRIQKTINGGRYVAGLASLADGSNTLAYLTGASYDDETYYVAFYTNALKVKVEKTLKPSTTNSNTGDAKVSGARYGIFADSTCTNLVTEVVTGEDGTAITEPIEYRKYWIRELNPSEGCTMDNTIYEVRLDQTTTDVNGQRIATIQSKEPVIYGGFRMIVSSSPDLSGSTTKIPSVGSEITLTLNSDTSQVYRTIIDAQGYADFTNIPFGQYTCTQTTKTIEYLDYMDPMNIFINSDKTFIYSKIINTETAYRRVKIIKNDAESGRLVTNSPTVYRVVDSAGQTVVQKILYPQVRELNEYSTADDTKVYGYVTLPDKLQYGTYEVYELQAPYGYYNQSLVTGQPIASFSVEANGDTDYDRVITVEVPTENKPQKANLTVSVKGNVLTGTNTQSAYGQNNVLRPSYSVEAIPGATYEIMAAEDIVTGDGVVHLRAGETMSLGETDNDGLIRAQLYIGKYVLRMTSAPVGYALDTTQREINVEYKGQTIETYNLPTENYTLVRQEYNLDVKKVFSGLYFFKRGAGAEAISIDADAYKDVIVGIYAAEDVKNVFGTTIIPRDQLVDVVIFDEDGNGTFVSDYPMGKFYAKEIQTNINYVLSDANYNFNVRPTNIYDLRFDVSVGSILNEAIKETTFKFTKIEEIETEGSGLSGLAGATVGLITGALSDYEATTTVTRLPGAQIAMHYLDTDGNYYPLLEKVNGAYLEVIRTTDAYGEFSVDGLPFGYYLVKEVKAPRYYDVNDGLYGFQLSPGHKDAELVLQDVRTKVDISLTIKDEDGNVLPGVTIKLIDPDTKKVAYETVTDEDGVASFDQIRAGRYIRVIDGLPEQYVVPGKKEVYLEEDNLTFEQIKVRYITGNILINKTDEETGEPVKDALFAIKNADEETVVEATTDDNGQLLIVGLRYGNYTVEEVEAPEDYEKSDYIAEVSILEDGVTYEVDFTNLFTGDIAVALYVVMALVSVGAIGITVKRLKRD